MTCATCLAHDSTFSARSNSPVCCHGDCGGWFKFVREMQVVRWRDFVDVMPFVLLSHPRLVAEGFALMHRRFAGLHLAWVVTPHAVSVGCHSIVLVHAAHGRLVKEVHLADCFAKGGGGLAMYDVGRPAPIGCKEALALLDASLAVHPGELIAKGFGAWYEPIA